MYKFKFADIGEGLHEGRVAEIYVKVGDKVKEGDSLISVETEKVTTDISSPIEGVINEVLVEVGKVIHVGEVIFIIDDGKNEDNTSNEKKEEAAKGAGVVGEVQVSNEILDFNKLSFSKTKKNRSSLETSASRRSLRRAERIAKEEQKQVDKSIALNNAESFDKGKSFTGKVNEDFDLIVIGGGPGGYLAAELGAKEGLKTLIVEKEFYGGVCLNIGCIPTKTLLKAIELKKDLANASSYGLELKLKNLNYSEIQNQKQKVVAKLTSGVSMLLNSSGVRKVDGEAKFVGSHVIEVAGNNYRGKYIILATGSLDRKINLEGFDAGYKSGKVITSREALINTKPLTGDIVIIGGGVIGCEFAQIYSGLGYKVTIIHGGENLLTGLDKEAVAVVTKSLQDSGVEVVYNALPVSFNNQNSRLVFRVEGKKEDEIRVGTLLTAVGRYPVNSMVDKVGVNLDARGAVIVNNKCQTNVENFYAIGDCNAKNMLAHAAYRQAVVAINNIVGREDSFDQDPVPAVIYTIPELASVGLTEAELKKEKNNYLVAKFSYAHLGRGVSSTKEQGFCKFIVDKEDGRLLGATIVGYAASDLISQVALAIVSEASVFEIARTIHPHPSFSEIL